MINISKNAQNHFISLLSKEPLDTQIRVFIKNPGMSNAECGVAYCLKDEIEKSDVSFKYTGFYVYVNKKFLNYLKDSEIDLIIDRCGSQLTFKAPYARKNIIFNSDKNLTYLQEKVEDFLNCNINPQLSLHGGKVNLIKISKQGVIFINFVGGCNGCSMVNTTLKDTVENKILSYFPEIKKVVDQTDHLHGNHSFY